MNDKTILRWAALIAVLLAVLFVAGHALYVRVITGAEALGHFIYGEQGFGGLLISIATLGGAAFSVAALLRQNRVASDALRQSQLAEVATRFQKGVELLASGNPSVRVGGIYLLRDVANEAPAKYRATVISVLIEHAREHSAHNFAVLLGPDTEWYDDGNVPHRSAARPALKPTGRDVHLAVAVAGSQRLILQQTDEAPPLDFAGVALINCAFTEVDFSDCDFSSAYLVRVRFWNSYLLDSKFALGSGEMINFNSCDLKRADFTTTGAGRGHRRVTAQYCDLSHVRAQGQSVLTINKCNLDHAWLETWVADVEDCWFFGTAPMLGPDHATGVMYQPATGHGSFNRFGPVRVYQPGADEPIWQVLPDRVVVPLNNA